MCRFTPRPPVASRRAPPSPTRGEGKHRRAFHPQCRWTYSYSTGRLLMPRSEGAIGARRNPARKLRLPFRGADDMARGIDGLARPGADAAAEARTRQRQFAAVARLDDEAVPALDADLAVADIGAAHRFVHGIAQRYGVAGDAALSVRHVERHRAFLAEMVGEIRLVRPTLDARREIAGGVRGDLGAEEVERGAEPEIEIALDGRKIDRALGAHRLRILAAELLHHFERAAHDPRDAGVADEHVMRFLGQHELAAAREWIETALGEALQLELAVAVGEIREHEEGEPVADRLVEGAEDARLVGIARMARQQLLRLLAPVAAEIGMEQIDHGPEMPALFDIHLEEVAQVIERGADMAEEPLLLDRGGLGVALRHDEAPQRRAVLARHLLPGRLAEFVAEADGAVGRGVGEENAPAILRHLDGAVARPTLGVDRGGRAQIDVGVEEIARPHLAPPVEEARLPMLERALQRAVLGETDIVRDPLLIIDGHGVRPFPN